MSKWPTMKLPTGYFLCPVEGHGIQPVGQPCKWCEALARLRAARIANAATKEPTT